MEKILCLFQTIQGKRVIDSHDDLMIFKEKRDGHFSMKLIFKALVQLDVVVCPHRFIWNTWVSTKVSFFFCLGASWGKMLTLDQLKRRERALVNRCFLYGEEKEMVDHLLVHCSKARLPWDLFLAVIGVNWVFPLSVRETLLGRLLCGEKV